jgi:hypothetical protein
MPDYDGDRRGGSSSTRNKGSGAAAAVVVALIGAVAVAGSDGIGRTSPGDAKDPAVIRTVQARTVAAKVAARKGHYDEAWRRLTLRGGRRLVDPTPHCAAVSFGRVRSFFLTTPCRSLQRSLLALNDPPRHDTIVVSIAWVRLPTAGDAQRLRRLVDAPGTGNVSPIASNLPDLRSARFPGEYYASRQSGSLVVIAEATSTRGHPGAVALLSAAQVAAEFPGPP